MNEQPRDLFFGELIQAYLDDPYFQPRPWLSKQIEEQLAEQGCRFVLLLGEPGAGKSALQAWLASQQPGWPRYFIRRDSQHPLRSGEARSFLFAVGHQLAARRPQLFDPGQVKIIVEQRVAEQRESGRAVGVEIGELIASPFYQTSLQVSQEVELQAGELIGLSVGRHTPEPRFMEVANLQFLALLDPAELLQRLDPQQRLVVLVDALDELRYSSPQDSLLGWLADLPRLPDNLRFVLTSRPDETLLAEFRQRQGPWLREIEIDPDSQAVQQDLLNYARGFAEEPAFREHMAAEQVDPGQFVQTVVERAEGNFLYLSLLRRGIVQAVEQQDRELLHALLHSEGIPEGLQGLYAHFLSRLRAQVGEARVELEGDTPLETVSQPAWEALYQPLLGVFATAFEPLEAGQVRRLAQLRVEERYLQAALQRMGQFLDQRAGRASLYHATLAEFLTSPGARQRYPALYLDPVEWHRKIAGAYRKGASSWEVVDWAQADDYGLLHLPRHLHALAAEPRYRAEYFGVFCRSFILEKRRRYGSYAQVHQDVTLGIRTTLQAIPAELPQLTRLILLRSIISDITSGLPEQVITALLQLGESEQALGAAALIQAPDQRARVYEELARVMIERGQEIEAGRVLALAAAAAWQHIFDSTENSMVSHNDIAAYLAQPAASAARAGKLVAYLVAYQDAGGNLDPYLLALLADEMAQLDSKEGATEAVRLAIGNLERWELSADTHLAALAFSARALARAGEAEQAADMISQVQRFAGEHPVEGVELGLAPALALLGNFDQARKITLENLRYEESQEALLILAQALVQGGQLDQALELAEHAAGKDDRDAILGQIALALARGGEDGAAAEVASRMTYGDRYAAALRDLAAVQARAGRLSAALHTIRLLERTHEKLALPLSNAEIIQRAKEGIRTDVPALQAGLLRLLASRLPNQAGALWQIDYTPAGLEPFATSEDARLQSAAARLSAAAALAADDLEAARSIHAGLPAGLDRLEVLRLVIHALVARGDAAGARRMIEQEQDLTRDGRALFGAELAQVLYAAGQHEDARQEMQAAISLLETLPASEQAVTALCAAGAQLLAAGKPEVVNAWLALGEKLWNHLGETIPYVHAAARLSQTYLQLGSPQQALELIERASRVQVSDYSTQAAALRHLLPAVAALNDLTQTLRLAGATLQVVQRLDEPLERAETLAVVVRCVAENGLFEDALGLAVKVDNPLYILQALGDLLEQLGPQGDRSLAEQAAKAAHQQMQQGTGMWQYHGKQAHVIGSDFVQQLKGYATAWRQEALVHSRLARGFKSAGYPDLAGEAFARARQLGEKATDRAEGPAALAELAETASLLGQEAAAGELARQADELARKAEDWETYALGLSSAAQAYWEAGEMDRAQELALEGWSALARFALAQRVSVYGVLERSAAVLGALDGGETLAQVGQRLAEVEAWWVE